MTWHRGHASQAVQPVTTIAPCRQHGHDFVALLQPNPAELNIFPDETRLGELDGCEAQELLNRQVRAAPMVAMVFLLLGAGSETTTHLISGSVYELITAPALRDWLDANQFCDQTFAAGIAGGLHRQAPIYRLVEPHHSPHRQAVGSRRLLLCKHRDIEKLQTCNLQSDFLYDVGQERGRLR